MDKTRFTRDPHLDSEGFVMANPAGWQEVDGVALPSVWTWAIPYEEHDSEALRVPYKH